MSKTKKNTKPKPVITLTEKCDSETLQKLIITESIPKAQRTLLKKYYDKYDKDANNIVVGYNYSTELKNKGRLYANGSLSLQNFEKKIRGVLAYKYYLDVDMKNAHPVLTVQYCEKNGIECPLYKKYVEEREKILKEIMEFHNVSRIQAKKLPLRLAYGGDYLFTDEEGKDFQPTKQMKYIIDLKKELYQIGLQICELETEIFEEIRKDKKKINKIGSVMSVVAQIIENDCLIAMKDYFEKRTKYKVGTLCFDGLMIKADKKDTEYIRGLFPKIYDYVKRATQYTIELDIKPFNEEEPQDIEKYLPYVGDDLECAMKLIEIEGKEKFKYNGGKFYIFNELNGLYEEGESLIYYYLQKNQKYLTVVNKAGYELGNYGRQTNLMKRIPLILAPNVKIDNWENLIELSSIGKLLFSNGIYDMKQNEFTREYSEKIVFMKSIPLKYLKIKNNEQEVMNYARELFFNALFKPEQVQNIILTIALAIAGEKIKRLYFFPGNSNAGKSLFTNILTHVFGTYVSTFNTESLCMKDREGDEAQDLRWSYLKRDCRLLCGNELKMNKILDGNKIKKQTGNDNLEGRLHCGNETRFKPAYTIFILLNDIPQIQPYDDAVKNRMTYYNFPYIFTEEEEKIRESPNIYKRMNRNLEIDLKNDKKFITGMYFLIFNAYKKYLEDGILPVGDADIKAEWEDGQKQEDQFEEYIYKDFIKCDENEYITVREINEYKEMNHKIFGSMSSIKFNKLIVEKFGCTKGKNNKGIRIWRGIKRTSNNDI